MSIASVRASDLRKKAGLIFGIQPSLKRPGLLRRNLMQSEEGIKNPKAIFCPGYFLKRSYYNRIWFCDGFFFSLDGEKRGNVA